MHLSKSFMINLQQFSLRFDALISVVTINEITIIAPTNHLDLLKYKPPPNVMKLLINQNQLFLSHQVLFPSAGFNLSGKVIR